MAQRTTVVVTDDMDDSEGAQTYTFAYQGTQYEIDLSEKNAAKLERALAPFIEAGRRVSGSGGRRSPSGRRSSSRSSGDASAIREWAKANNIEVSDRGRVSAAVRERYENER